MNERELIDNFTTLYYTKPEQTWKTTRWMGILLQKFPTDLWIYQEIFYELRPDLIIETGTLYGGSAYYMAHLCDVLGNGKIITIDDNSYQDDFDKIRPFHSRIKYLTGSSTDPEIIKTVESNIAPTMKVIVILHKESCFKGNESL
jgi:cephalosporin hydroxylase